MKRLISLIIATIVLLSTLIGYLSFKGSVAQKASFGDDYTILRLFDEDGFSKSELSPIRFAIESASSNESGSEGRLWCDAYSYFTTVYASRGEGNPIECSAIVTGGDFFAMHELDFVTGWYYSDTDMNSDRVVIDERLAFQLFGSNFVEDLQIRLGSELCYVAGVVAIDETPAKEIQLGDKPLVYIPESIAQRIFGENNYDSYEIMMQNSVDSYALNAISSAAEGKQIIDVVNRYQLKKTLSLIKEFPMRSYHTDKIEYPYWENVDRGNEDILAVLLIVNVIALILFVFNLVLFIIERKKR